MINIKGLKKKYNNNYALIDVSFQIKHGEIISVIGPSGSGKSTLLKIISGVLDYSAGEVSIDGFRLESNYLKKNVYKDISLVFQQLFLWPHIKVIDNICMAIKDDQKKIDYASKLISYFDIQSLVDRYPHELSIGERQRVAIIRAIVIRPKYLLLDEVTSALDVNQIIKLSDLLKELSQENMSILIVTHLIGFAKKVSDRIIYIENGSVLADVNARNIESEHNQSFRSFIGLC